MVVLVCSFKEDMAVCGYVLKLGRVHTNRKHCVLTKRISWKESGSLFGISRCDTYAGDITRVGGEGGEESDSPSI